MAFIGKIRVGVLLSLVFVALSLGLFSSTINLTRAKIGQPFPGYLTFENGVVGPFHVPGWSGPREGRTAHKIVPLLPADDTSSGGSLFSGRDYLLIVLFPTVSGLLFVLFGIGLCLFLPPGAGRLPLLLFHFLVGNYLILSPEIQLTHHFSLVLLGFFAFIPAPMIHFALLFPERVRLAQRYPSLYFVSYALSALLLLPYLALFKKNPSAWIVIEYVVVFYVILGYLFWIIRLIRTFRRPQLEFNRIIARYLLPGQALAFLVPLMGALAIFVGGISFPINLATPLTLLFPMALFIGVILGRLRQSQMQLVQAEKRGALGGLLAGLAHEINNPMTFLYSAIEPLREAFQVVQTKTTDSQAMAALHDANQLIDAMEEGATRAKGIIEDFRNFSQPDRGEVREADLHAIIEQGLRLLTPKWKDRIEIVRRFEGGLKVKCLPTEMGQVFVNLLANACDAIPKNGSIEIVTEKALTDIKISICDTGQGIPPENLARVFDPFYTTKAQGEGTGLGLSITLEIIKRHRGTINVKSEVGKGTEFVVTLPRT